METNEKELISLLYDEFLLEKYTPRESLECIEQIIAIDKEYAMDITTEVVKLIKEIIKRTK